MKRRHKFMVQVLKSMDEIKDDIEGIYDEIIRQADEHIN